MRTAPLTERAIPVRSEIVPPNRVITIALILGLLALIGYGVYTRNPVTIIIVAVLLVFFGLPALALYSLNRRTRQRPPSLHPSDAPEDAPV